jgi:hypothetical protein
MEHLTCPLAEPEVGTCHIRFHVLTDVLTSIARIVVLLNISNVSIIVRHIVTIDKRLQAILFYYFHK